jgi:hypothetical protein
LYHEVRLERSDDIACSFASFLRGKPRNVVTVPVGSDDGMKLAPGPLLDVFGESIMRDFGTPLGKAVDPKSINTCLSDFRLYSKLMRKQSPNPTW